MTVRELSENAKFKALTLPCPEREIHGVYVGDLLSWVMGRAKADNAWITIMSNVNVLAVATLADIACVILAEDVVPDPEVLTAALEKGINVLSTPLTAYEAAVVLSRQEEI